MINMLMGREIRARKKTAKLITELQTATKQVKKLSKVGVEYSVAYEDYSAEQVIIKCFIKQANASYFLNVNFVKHNDEKKFLNVRSFIDISTTVGNLKLAYVDGTPVTVYAKAVIKTLKQNMYMLNLVAIRGLALQMNVTSKEDMKKTLFAVNKDGSAVKLRLTQLKLEGFVVLDVYTCLSTCSTYLILKFKGKTYTLRVSDHEPNLNRQKTDELINIHAKTFLKKKELLAIINNYLENIRCETV